MDLKSVLAVPESFLRKQGVKNPKQVVYGTLTLAGVILIAIIIFRIIRRRGGSYTSGKTQKELKEGLADIKIHRTNLTLTDSQATIIAQNLLNAMDRWGTDEQAIKDNLGKAQTADDLYLIIQKFGVLPYDGLGLSDTLLSNWVAAVMKNLNGWLRAELGGRDLKDVKAIFDKLGVPF